MSSRFALALAAILVLSTPVASQAALAGYSQNFEGLAQADPAALSNDGWLVYGNVYTPAQVYMYGYGPFPAPNPGPGFCAIDAGQGGAQQGAQQLSVYSDYNNTDHANGNLIESNVYREQTVAAGDVGGRWTFQFDAKRGNLAGASTAVAFIKTLDPSNGYALTNYITVPMTSIPTTWGTYAVAINVTSDLVGQLMQFGFANVATHYESSGIYYDNLLWSRTGNVDVAGSPRGDAFELRAAAPNPFRISTRVGFSTGTRGRADVSIYDIGGRRVATLFHGIAEAGSHSIAWDGRTADGRLAAAGVYRCVLRTDAGHQARAIVLSR